MGLRARLQRQLKDKLINEDIKLRKIAIATGISKATLSRITRGKTPTLEVYQKLNNYLNPETETIVKGDCPLQFLINRCQL
jgi:transcriptional regulator with XRE-family HTH domain